MEWLIDNLTEFLVYLGLALLAIESIVLGFSTFVLFFLGLASVLTGALMFLGIFPETITSALLGVGILTAVLGIGLWQPLKKFQNNVKITIPRSDLIGLSFLLENDVSPTEIGQHRYSGIIWQVLSSETLAAGTEVEVIKTEVGAFTVAAKKLVSL